MTNDFPAETAPGAVVTLVFTDIEGSSELWERFRESFAAVLEDHNRLMRRVALQHGGVEVKNLGDSFLFAWENAHQAVAFAVEVQQTINAHPWPPEIGAVCVRIGIHTGPAHSSAQPNGQVDYFGPAVNRASRIEAAGYGGQILASEATREWAAPLLPIIHPEIEWRDLGVHRLRGVGEEHLWQVRHHTLPSDFPPLRTSAEPRVRLPNFLTLFMARETDVENVQTLLLDDSVRLLVLTGPGGVGKTRLSVRVAEKCVEHFADGLWFVELETAITPREFWSRVAYALEIPISGAQNEEFVVLQFLGGKNLLLVLDNVEQIEEAAAVIERITRATKGVKCLVSSRERLAVSGAHNFEVAPLGVPGRPQRVADRPQRLDLAAIESFEGVRFFLARARSHQSTFALSHDNVAAIGELCRWLEGVPLALELAAAWIPDLSPQEILHELQNREASGQLDVLSFDSTTLPERQRAIRSSIDWSFTRLSHDEQIVLLQLSTCAGGFTRDAAQKICGLSNLRLLALLRRLNAKSLLTSDESGGLTRYGMLRTIRRYGEEKLQESGVAFENRQAHARYFLSFARDRLRHLRTAEESAALREIDADLENLRAALDWSLQNEQHELAAPLSLAIGQFMERRGLQKEALRCVQCGLEQIEKWPAETVPARLLADLCRERASLHLDQFEWPQARECSETALELSQRENDVAGEASALNLLGLTASRQGQFEDAHEFFQRALKHHRTLNDDSGRAIVLHNLGLLATLSNQPDEARKYFESALKSRREIGDQRGLAETLNNLGVLAQERDEFDAAWNFYLESLECEVRLSHSFGIGRALYNLGEIAGLQDRAPQATRLFAGAERLFEETGSPYQPLALTAMQTAQAETDIAPETLAEMRSQLRDYAPAEIAEWALKRSFLPAT